MGAARSGPGGARARAAPARGVARSGARALPRSVRMGSRRLSRHRSSRQDPRGQPRRRAVARPSARIPRRQAPDHPARRGRARGVSPHARSATEPRGDQRLGARSAPRQERLPGGGDDLLHAGPERTGREPPLAAAGRHRAQADGGRGAVGEPRARAASPRADRGPRGGRPRPGGGPRTARGRARSDSRRDRDRGCLVAGGGDGERSGRAPDEEHRPRRFAARVVALAWNASRRNVLPRRGPADHAGTRVGRDRDRRADRVPPPRRDERHLRAERSSRAEPRRGGRGRRRGVLGRNRTRAARPGRAGVRHKRGARASDAPRRPCKCGRGPPGRREGERPGSRPVPGPRRAAVQPPAAARPCAARPGPRPDRAGGRRGRADRGPGAARSGRRRGTPRPGSCRRPLSPEDRGAGQPRPCGAGALEPDLELGEIRARGRDRAYLRRAERFRLARGDRLGPGDCTGRSRPRARALLPRAREQGGGRLRSRAVDRLPGGGRPAREAGDRGGRGGRRQGSAPAAPGVVVAETILVVEDEAAIADAVAYALEAEGFEVERAEDGEQALEHARQRPYDLVVLDLRLPKISGIEVCRTLRTESAIPILMLTAKDSELDRVVGLEVGADDYVTKPFSMAELMSRVRAILRRRRLDQTAAEPVRRIGGLELDLVRHEVRTDGQTARLTPSEFKLLAFLASEPERVFTRREIMQHLWESDYVGDERSSDMHISNLRRKIERDPDKPARVVTVRGGGYKLVPA